jgi:serine/threonine protein kinase/tetratricopeptide (TPR) repeat protein
MNQINLGTSVDGRYKIVAALGAGGMGDVYAAEDRDLHRSVALKFLHPGLTQNLEALERFKREAHTLSTIAHKGVVRIFSYGVWKETHPYIVMELLEGQPLSKLMRDDGPLPTRRALAIALDVAESLEILHANDIIHRDIKPSNIFITTEGRAKIIDFGLCKVADSLDNSQIITQPGYIVGSPSYMSPEACFGKPAGASTDIYSLGVVLFEMLTGKPPFASEVELQTMLSQIVQKSVPRLSEDYPLLPHAEEMDELLKRFLAKATEDRFNSTEAVVAIKELLDQLRQSPVLKLKPQKRDSSRRLNPLLGTLSLAIFSVLILLFCNPATGPKLLFIPACLMPGQQGLQYRLTVANWAQKYLPTSYASGVYLEALPTSDNFIVRAYILSELACLAAKTDKILARSNVLQALQLLGQGLEGNHSSGLDTLEPKWAHLSKVTLGNCEQALRLSESSWNASLDRAVDEMSRVYERVSQSRGSAQMLPLYRLRLELLGSHAHYWHRIALARAECASGRLEEGIASYQTALRVLSAAPKSDSVHADEEKILVEIGDSYDKLKEYARAVAFYRQAEEVAHQRPVLLYEAAEARILQGKALVSLKRFKDGSDKFESGLRTLEQIPPDLKEDGAVQNFQFWSLVTMADRFDKLVASAENSERTRRMALQERIWATQKALSYYVRALEAYKEMSPSDRRPEVKAYVVGLKEARRQELAKYNLPN